MAQRRYPPELRERAVRLVSEWRASRNRSDGGLKEVASQSGVHHESLRNWLRQAEVDEGQRPGVTSEQAARIAELIYNPRFGPWRTVEDVELATLAWVDWWNNRRLHSSIGDRPPAECETIWAQTRENQALRSAERLSIDTGASMHPVRTRHRPPSTRRRRRHDITRWSPGIRGRFSWTTPIESSRRVDAIAAATTLVVHQHEYG
jgi:transposase